MFSEKNPVDTDLFFGCCSKEKVIGITNENRESVIKGGLFLKRLFDILLSLFGIIASFPLAVLIGFLVWIEDGGSVFFYSKRIGRRGRVFNHIKFRTMVSNSSDLFAPIQASENDQRITRIGNLLRATALDELPQLWNIVRGDMSFVGPRPLLPTEIEVSNNSSIEEAMPLHEIPGYARRHSVRPGLTGIAQIFASRDIIRKRKFHYDLIYVKRQSMFLDIKLIVLSFWITFRGKWESRSKKF